MGRNVGAARQAVSTQSRDRAKRRTRPGDLQHAHAVASRAVTTAALQKRRLHRLEQPPRPPLLISPHLSSLSPPPYPSLSPTPLSHRDSALSLSDPEKRHPQSI